jgi:hypothetical protein
VAGVQGPVGEWAADAYQKSDGQDAGLQGRLTGDDLRDGSVSLGGGHHELGLDLGPTYDGRGTRHP